uniref:Parathyroid hormone n=1 Tax=Poecilia reticulata TaxID=8081 RepID=A0A3P9QJ16_POERE
MLLKSDININCEICSLMTGQGNPVYKGERSISEVQFMHNVQEHKQVGERQDWLQEKLKKIIIPSPKPQYARPGNPKIDYLPVTKQLDHESDKEVDVRVKVQGGLFSFSFFVFVPL